MLLTESHYPTTDDRNGHTRQSDRLHGIQLSRLNIEITPLMRRQQHIRKGTGEDKNVVVVEGDAFVTN